MTSLSPTFLASLWSRFARLVLACVLFVGTFGVAQAHDPFECWASALVKPEQLDLTLTMAESTALRLVDPQAKIRGVTSEVFAKLKPDFEKAAGELMVITSLRKPLVPKSVQVERTEENDIVFRVIYPRPAVGRLHFHAAFLKKLGEGYGGILEASDTSGNHLGWEQISTDNPNYEVTVLPPGQGPAKKN